MPIVAMARIMAIDYGSKRSGIAVSDPQQLIAGGLTTVPTAELEQFLANYISKEPVTVIVLGFPTTLRGEAATITTEITPLIERLRIRYPDIKIETMDERFTSKMAFRAMIEGGLHRKARRNKALIDQVSATIMLEEYMEKIKQSHKS